MDDAIKIPPAPKPDAPPETGDDQVWTYHGYHMRIGEFNTAMVHLYRAEITRSNTWRTRLDTTTNWAVVTTGTALSFALSNPNIHYGVLVLDTLLLTLFLWIEARRYRYYELWSYRARLLETDFFAAMLVPPYQPRAGWAEDLAQSLRHPTFPISMWEAVGRRLRRNYLWLYIIVGLAWGLKSYLYPAPATSWAEFEARSAVGPISGAVMVGIGVLYNGALVVLALLTIGLHHATGEVLQRED